MKKAMGILLSIIAATCVAAIMLYYIRDYQANRQVVHKDSASILTICVDDLIIANINPIFFARSKKRLPADSTRSTLLRDIWNAGLDIPARLLFFSLAQDPHTFYSVRHVRNPTAWNSFLKKYAQDSLSVEKHRFYRINNYIQVVQQDTRIAFRFGARDTNWNQDDTALVTKKNPLIPLRQIDSYTNRSHVGHLTYWQSDGRLSLAADLSGKEITIQGTWRTPDTLQKSPYLIRNMQSDDAAILMWSALPARGVPAFYEPLLRITEQDPNTLSPKLPNYLDLLVSHKMVDQQDTIITYDYDEEFNSVETETLQTVQVPLIESLWQGNANGAQQFPEKLFYKFYKHTEADAVMISTEQSAKNSFTYAKSPYIFMLQLNMKNWPTNWIIAPLEKLQKAGLKASVEASVTDQHQVTIHGSVVTDEALFSIL